MEGEKQTEKAIKYHVLIMLMKLYVYHKKRNEIKSEIDKLVPSCTGFIVICRICTKFLQDLKRIKEIGNLKF